MRHLPVLMIALAVLVAGCSSGATDPTTTSTETTTVPVTIAEAQQTTTIVSNGAQITLSLKNVEGFSGLGIDAWVLPLILTEEKQALGGTGIYVPTDPFSASDAIHPMGENYFSVVEEEVAMFEPGEYRFIIEAYVPSGPMRYGCEKQIVVPASGTVELIFTSLPEYTGDGWHWALHDELEYPQCPAWSDQT